MRIRTPSATARVATSVSEGKRIRSPVRQAQGPEPVEGLALAATGPGANNCAAPSPLGHRYRV